MNDTSKKRKERFIFNLHKNQVWSAVIGGALSSIDKNEGRLAWKKEMEEQQACSFNTVKQGYLLGI